MGLKQRLDILHLRISLTKRCHTVSLIIQMNDDTTLILHHYELSPFSEKARALLGYLNLPWCSAEVSPALPRDELMQLTGGYRRIPVLQIGADIYCDTRLIAHQLQARQPNIDIFHGADKLALERAAWADTRLFQIALTASLGWSAMRNLRGYFTARQGLNLVLDRIKMARGAQMPRIGPSQAREELHEFLRRFDSELVEDFAFGPSPGIADFAMYHPLHFAHVRAASTHLQAYPRVLAWLERMVSFRSAPTQQLNQTEALQLAQRAQPSKNLGTAELPWQSGTRVSIRPTDYGVTPVVGELIAATPYSWTLRRESPDAGLLHVHFPRDGFALEPAQS